MAYIPFFVICLIVLLPIILPLAYWYILGKKDSKLYEVCLYIRRFFSIISLLLFAYKIRDFPNLNSVYGDPAEFAGAIVGQILLIFLLWKKWKKDTESIPADIKE